MIWLGLIACVAFFVWGFSQDIGPLGCFPGLFAGVLAFVVIAIVVIIIKAFSTDYCKEYGYPENYTDTCSDSDIQYFIEHNGKTP